MACCAQYRSGRYSARPSYVASSASTSSPRRRASAAAATTSADGPPYASVWFCVQLSTQNGSHTRASAAMHAPVHREKLAGWRSASHAAEQLAAAASRQRPSQPSRQRVRFAVAFGSGGGGGTKRGSTKRSRQRGTHVASSSWGSSMFVTQ